MSYYHNETAVYEWPEEYESLTDLEKEERQENEEICERYGHEWYEMNPDLDSASSDLYCERCGCRRTLYWRPRRYFLEMMYGRE